MKKEFPGYYRPTEDEFSSIWESCDFLFDTNILFNLYRYTKETKNTLIGILEDIEDRIWLPYQVGMEYHTRRVEEIKKLENAYDSIEAKLTDFLRNITDYLRKEFKSGRHPLINCEDFIGELSGLIEKYVEELNDKKIQHPDWLIDDPIKEKLSELFEGKVCEKLDNEIKENVLEEGEERYKEKIPPGYEDKNKSGIEKYGDLIIWFEIIKHAKKRKKPIIFVTDDGKEDWWYISHGKTIGPRPELISEILKNAGVKFYMYSSDKFMSYAEEYLESKVEQTAIDEAREIRLQEEKTQHQLGKQEEWFRSLISAGALSEKNELLQSSLAGMDLMEKATKDMLNIAEMTTVPEFLRNTLAISAMDENMLKMAEMAKATEFLRNTLAISAMDEVALKARDANSEIYRQFSGINSEVQTRSRISEEDQKKLSENDSNHDESKFGDFKPDQDSNEE